VRREENHANELKGSAGERRRDAEKEDPEKIQEPSVNDLAEEDAGADDSHAQIKVAITAQFPLGVWPQLSGVAPADKNVGQGQKNQKCAAPTPDPYRRGFKR
jgi:hypothetical protein